MKAAVNNLPDFCNKLEKQIFHSEKIGYSFK